MGTQILFIVFCVIVQFCRVSGRHNFFEHYYSRYHKGHSTTTESLFPSSSDSLASSEYEQGFSQLDYNLWGKTNDMISTSDDNVLKNNKYEVTDDASLQNNMYEPTGERHRFHHLFISRTLLIVGSIIAFLIIVAVIVCCCPKCCRGTEYRAHSRTDNTERAAEVVPSQPVFIPYPVQQAAVQHLPVQYAHEQSLPAYQPRTIQQQPQRSQGQHLPVQYPQEYFPPEYQPQIMQTQPHNSLGQHFSQQHPQEHFLPEYQPHIAQQQPICSLGQHSYNLPEAPPPYESHIKY